MAVMKKIMDQDKATAGITSSPKYSKGAVTRAIQSNDLTETGVNRLTSSDSKYMQVAEQRGLDWAANRGASNDTMAVGAAQREAIAAALPIASEDANKRFQQGLTNQQVLQQTTAQRIGTEDDLTKMAKQGQIEKGLMQTQGRIQSGQIAQQGQIQAKLAAQQIAGDSRLQAERGKIEQKLMGIDNAFQRNMQVLRGDQAVQLANIEARYKERLQGSASAAELMANTQTQIATIMGNKDLSAAQQQAAVNRIIDTTESGLTIVESLGGTEFTNLLNFGGAPVTRAATTPSGGAGSITPGGAVSKAVKGAVGGASNATPPATSAPASGDLRRDPRSGLMERYTNGRWELIR